MSYAGQPSPAHWKYRIVTEDANCVRRVVSEGLTRDLAFELMQTLLNSDRFQIVSIERDEN